MDGGVTREQIGSSSGGHDLELLEVEIHDTAYISDGPAHAARLDGLAGQLGSTSASI